MHTPVYWYRFQNISEQVPKSVYPQALRWDSRTEQVADGQTRLKYCRFLQMQSTEKFAQLDGPYV